MIEKKEKKSVGRPTAMTPEVVGKLEYAFMKGFTDQQASDYAGIDRTTLSEYCKKYPEFSRKKEVLKSHLIIRSKILLGESIEGGDVNKGLWLLERKAKDEFSTRTESTGANGEAIKVEAEVTQRSIKEVLVLLEGIEEK